MLDKPYFLSLTIISAFAASALFSIWRFMSHHVPVNGKKDLGLLYLSGAMGVWMVVGLWGFVAPYFPIFITEAVFSISSTANSLLYLLAIQHFDYAPEQIRRRWWRPAIISFAICIAFASIFLSWYCFKNNISKERTSELVNWPDVIFSAPTILALSVGFWRSFYYRGYKFLAGLSIAAMAIILIVQLPDASHWLKDKFGEVERWLTISSYALLMMFCFALAASWGVEEFSLPLANQIYMTFDNGGDKWQIHFRIREQRFTAYMSPMAFKNLLLFVVKSIENPQNGWVRIEKDLNGGYVDFRRILSPVAEAWKGADLLFSSDMKASVEKVRRTLFEYQNTGQYRLRAGVGNWKFTDAFFSRKAGLADAMSSRLEREEVYAMFGLIQAWTQSQGKNNTASKEESGP